MMKEALELVLVPLLMVFVLLVVFAYPARGAAQNTVYLKDGSVLRGQIIEETEEVIVIEEILYHDC